MLKKYQEWKKKPITWGSYIKLCKISLSVSAVIAVAELAYIYKQCCKSEPVQRVGFECQDDTDTSDEIQEDDVTEV